MDVTVLSKLREGIPHTLLPSNLVGDSMLVRLRSASIGILGIVTAVGLALVIVISQQGWPGALDSPLPQAPSGLTRNDPIALPGAGRGSPVRINRVAARPAPAPAAEPVRSVAPPAPPVVAQVPVEPVAVAQPHPAGHSHHSHPGHATQPAAAPPATTVQAPPESQIATDSSEPAEAEPEAKAPGHSGEAPGHSGGSPGHSGEAPGHAADGPPGHAADGPPGHSGEPPESAGGSPGHSSQSPLGQDAEHHGGRH